MLPNTWTKDHWINLLLFVASLLFTGLGQITSWEEIPRSITPVSVSGFAMAVLTFLRTMYTQKPRQPFGERRGDE